MAVIIPVVSKFDDKGIKQAQSAFAGLGSSMKGILGAAGIGIGLNSIISGFKDSAQAAIADTKSQALLAQQLKNTMGASDAQIASVEASISAMQRQSAVADDNIRPAMAALTRATGDLGSATKLTSLALDVSAGTGRDVQSVAIALGKAYQGNTTALQRMGINVKGMKDPLGELAKQFKGAAEAAAKNDPLARLNVIFDDMKEKVGTALLPALNNLADYFGSSTGQKNLDDFATSMGDVATAVTNMATAMSNLKPILDPVFGSLNTYLALLAGDSTTIAKNMAPFLQWIPGYTEAATKAGIIGTKTPKVSKGLTANEKFLLKQSLKTYGGPGPGGGGNGKTDAQKLADAQAKAAKTLADALKKAKSDIAQANKDIVSEYQDSVKAFEEQTKAISDYKTQIGDLVGSTKPLAFEEKQVGRFASAVIDSFDSISASIKDNSAMFSDGGASLQKYVATERVLLEDLAAQRDALATKYSLAKAVKSDIESAILSFGNITNLLDKQSTQVTETLTTVVDGIQLTRTKLIEQTTTSGIVANFQAILDKTKAFAESLKKLRALGLDQNLYKQIVDAGVEAGGQTAEAILAGGSDTVSSLNSIFKDLNSVGADIGEQTAQVMYGAGVDLTNGLLEGIKSQDQALMDQANAMAKLFADTFNGMVSQLMIQPTKATSPTLASQYPGFSDYINGALAGYSGDALASQIDMLTGANVSAPGSFMNSLGYMKSSPITVNVNAGMIANKQEIPAMIVDALGTYTKQSGAGGLTRVLGL